MATKPKTTVKAEEVQEAPALEQAEAIPGEVQETPTETVVYPQVTFLEAAHDVHVGPSRLDPAFKSIRTLQEVEIPAGGFAILISVEPMRRTPLRLAERFVLNQTNEVVRQPISVLLDNIGPDGFFLRKGTVIAACVLVSPK